MRVAFEFYRSSRSSRSFVGTVLSTKAIAITATSALFVGGAVVGGFYLLVGKPQLAVVQRAASVEVPARGEASAVASCLSHETNLNGGYGFDGPAFATSSLRVEPRSWQVGAYNPTDSPVTLTAYAVCVNAAVSVTTGSPVYVTAFSDRVGDKIMGRDTDLTSIEPMKDWYLDHGNPACRSGWMVGITFRPGRSVPWLPVAPVPLTSSIPNGMSTAQVWLNSGTVVGEQFPIATTDAPRNTRIPFTQPPEWNFRLEVAPVCAMVTRASLAAATVDVAGGGSGEAAIRCPTGQHPVGGGFDFPDHRTFGGGYTAAEFLDDGWIFATINARPAARRRQQDPHVVCHRSQSANAGRVLRELALSPMCATIDAEPVVPPAEPEPPRVFRPDALPAIDLSPTATPPVTATPTPTPIPTPTQTPTPTHTHTTTTQTQTQAPQKPAVTIQTPTDGGQLCAGRDAHFAGTAKRKPSNQLITDAKYTRWQIRHAPGGPLTLGTGASGDFLVSANLPFGASFTLVFTATDPTNGLSNKASVNVVVVACSG